MHSFPCISKPFPTATRLPPSFLREGWREGGKVKKRTLANLSKWPPTLIDGLARAAQGRRRGVPPRRRLRHRAFQTPRPCRGRAQATLRKTARLDRTVAGADSPRAPTLGRAGDDRRPDPRSGFGSWRPPLGAWPQATAASTRSPPRWVLEDCDEPTIFTPAWTGCSSVIGRHRAALGQVGISKDGALVLYDLTSVWLEGRRCPRSGDAATRATASAASCRSSSDCCATASKPSGGGAGVRRQHGGSGDRGGADRQAAASVRDLQGRCWWATAGC